MLTRLNSVWVFAFVALLIVVPLSYAVVPLLAAATLLVGLALTLCRADWRRLDRDDGLLCLVLLAYGGLWLLDVWRTGHWPVGEGNQGVLLPLWPLLAAALLVGLRLHSPSPRVLWWAVSCGALGAGSIALYERLVLGQARASNGMNAIPFGDLALLLGALSLLAALWSQSQSRSRHRGLLACASLGALAGLLGSLLSGTRGGWIAAPLLLLLVYRAARRLVPTGMRRGIAAGVMALLLAMILLPQSGVMERVNQAANSLQQYSQGESRGTSVGLRLEMWRAGGILFIERPLTGWGEGRLEAARDALVEQGILHPGISRYDQLHSDMIDTAARRGLVGLTVLLLLYGVPLWLFWRRQAGSGADPTVSVLATAGMMVPIAFIDFGLTQSMLRDVRGLSGYLGLCVVCWAALRQAEEQSVY
ncbi:O-antigen ligase family protein [Vreelandella subglaciescola]|nr:O-antigen ligase family protein [Halomonas subglaciescola]